MKSQKYLVLILVSLILVLAPGCTNNNSTAQPLETTPVIPDMIITPITTDSTSETPTLIPTLPALEADMLLLELLKENGDCRLPCFWGLTPGQSTRSDALTTLVPLSSKSDFLSFQPTLIENVALDNATEFANISLLHLEDDHRLGLGISIVGSGDLIYLIHVELGAGKRIEETIYPEFDWTYMDDRVQYYLLPNILTEYGPPGSIMLNTYIETDPQYRSGDQAESFRILLVYPDQGFIMHLRSPKSHDGDDILGCPNDAQIEFRFYPPGSTESEMLQFNPYFQQIISTYKPIEDTTSLSIDNFYHLYRNPTEECIRTPSSNWPVIPMP